MKPIRTPNTNTEYGGENVLALPAERVDNTVLSTWEPTDGERVRIAEGAMIELAVHTHPPPPVSVIVAGPFCSECRQRMEWSIELQTWTCAHMADPVGSDAHDEAVG